MKTPELLLVAEESLYLARGAMRPAAPDLDPSDLLALSMAHSLLAIARELEASRGTAEKLLEALELLERSQ